MQWIVACRRSLIPVVVLSIAACTDPVDLGPNGGALRILEQHQASWRAHNVHDYDLVFRTVFCDCPWGRPEPVLVSVRNDSVTSARFALNGETIPNSKGLFYTVDRLFALLESELRSGAVVTDIAYHQKWNYPQVFDVH